MPKKRSALANNADKAPAKRRKSSRLVSTVENDVESTSKVLEASKKSVEAPSEKSSKSNRSSFTETPPAKKAKSETNNISNTAKALAHSTDDRKPGEARYWLMKAEPESRIENGVDVRFSIDDLASKKVPEPWDGIRNHVAKNNILAMRKGDLAFFYHSNCKTPGIVGTMEIVGEAIPDITSWNSKSPYYDPKSSSDKPRWFCPLVEFRQKFDKQITLEQLKQLGQDDTPIKDMQVLKTTRLSVSKVSKSEWDYLINLSKKDS